MKFVNRLVSSVLICLILSGCLWFTNPTPNIINSEIISYDEYGNQTSGIISISNDKTGFIVTKRFIERYNSMIDKYGKKFAPELKKDQGVSKIDKTDFYFISNQSMGYFLTMNDMRRLDVNVAKKK